MRERIIDYLRTADERTVRLVWFFLFGTKEP